MKEKIGNLKEKIRNVSKATWMRLAIIILSVLFLIAAATTVYFVVQYRNSINAVSQLSGALSENASMYDSKVSEYESYRVEKESEKQSYEEKISNQNQVYESQINELNKHIDNLNKQLSAKKESKPQPAPVPKPLTQHTGVKTVYLTFDDGPSQYTSQILNILDSYGVKATFFVTNGGKYNYLMKEIVNRGHQIGLHCYTHLYKSVYASDEAYLADLQNISNLVLQQTGIETKLMRFPGGSSNTISKKHSPGIMTRMAKTVTEKGYVYFDWNCSNGDADGAKTVSKQLKFCSEYPKTANDIIVLMHDTRSATLESLPYIIEYYHSQGMKFGVLTTAGPVYRHRIVN